MTFIGSFISDGGVFDATCIASSADSSGDSASSSLEIAGTVAAVGAGVDPARIGERVCALVAGLTFGLAVFAFGLSWAFTVLGLLLRSPNAVMNAGFMGIFPLTFLSNVFVEPETLPSALEAFVDVNPISDARQVGFIPSSQDSRPGEGVQVMHLHGILDDVVTVIVGLAVGDAALHAALVQVLDGCDGGHVQLLDALRLLFDERLVCEVRLSHERRRELGTSS